MSAIVTKYVADHKLSPIKNVDTVIIWDCRILRTVYLQYDYSMIKVSLQYFHIRYTFGNLHTVSYIRYFCIMKFCMFYTDIQHDVPV